MAHRRLNLATSISAIIPIGILLYGLEKKIGSFGFLKSVKCGLKSLATGRCCTFLDNELVNVIGSMIPAPFILFTIRPIFNYLKGTRMFKNIVEKLTIRSINNNGKRIKKYGAWGLLIFVAIPLPGTGGYGAEV